MKTLSVGDKAPEFTLADADGKDVSLSDFFGKRIVLYFYPKDDTPGCTIEAITFTKQIKAFQKLGAVVLGISPDTPPSHCAFRDKHHLAVQLLSDPEHTALDAYGVWKQKMLYGRMYFGVERTTFLINANGRIAKIWNKVKVDGHADEVLAAVETLVK